MTSKQCQHDVGVKESDLKGHRGPRAVFPISLHHLLLNFRVMKPHENRTFQRTEFSVFFRAIKDPSLVSLSFRAPFEIVSNP